MSREEAEREFLRLVAAYGLQWTAAVPAEAYASLQEVNAVLTPDDKRALLMRRWRS